MEKLKIDKTKLQTLANYAKENKISRRTAYNHADEGKIKTTVIDGVKFVDLS
jgi:predicted site-specific integrase-resolvase